MTRKRCLKCQRRHDAPRGNKCTLAPPCGESSVKRNGRPVKSLRDGRDNKDLTTSALAGGFRKEKLTIIREIDTLERRLETLRERCLETELPLATKAARESHPASSDSSAASSDSSESRGHNHIAGGAASANGYLPLGADEVFSPNLPMEVQGQFSAGTPTPVAAKQAVYRASSDSVVVATRPVSNHPHHHHGAVHNGVGGPRGEGRSHSCGPRDTFPRPAHYVAKDNSLTALTPMEYICACLASLEARMTSSRCARGEGSTPGGTTRGERELERKREVSGGGADGTQGADANNNINGGFKFGPRPEVGYLSHIRFLAGQVARGQPLEAVTRYDGAFHDMVARGQLTFGAPDPELCQVHFKAARPTSCSGGGGRGGRSRSGGRRSGPSPSPQHKDTVKVAATTWQRQDLPTRGHWHASKAATSPGAGTAGGNSNNKIKPRPLNPRTNDRSKPSATGQSQGKKAVDVSDQSEATPTLTQ